KSFHVDILARREGTFHQVLLAGYWDAVGEITFGNFGRSGGRRRCRRIAIRWRVLRLRLSVWIKRLLLRRILGVRLSFLRISGDRPVRPRRWLLDITRRYEQESEK